MHPYFDNNNNNNNDNSLLHYVSNIGIIILQETLMVKRRYMYCTVNVWESICLDVN